MEDTCLESTRKERLERMSFLFPQIFRDMLTGLKKKYNKDMTYIVMEAVNEWVIKRENISHAVDEINGQSTKPALVCNGGNKD